MLTFSRVCKSFQHRPALVDVSFAVPDRSRTAVVGVNGSGKSTLLRIAAGLVAADSGVVSAPAGIRRAYVPQDYALDGTLTAEAFLKRRTGVADAEAKLRRLEASMADGDEGAVDAYGGALEDYAAAGGYEIEERLERALEALGLRTDVLGRRITTLSGGEQVRVGLGALLATSADCYLLDEPTNNLDLPALDLLERFIESTDATFLIVSHDRALLRGVATDVVEIDEHAHTAERYGVGYADYLDLREAALAARSQRYAEHLAEVRRLTTAAAAARIAAGATRDRRAPRDNDKFARHFFPQAASKQAGRRIRNLERRLERLDAPDEPRSGWELRLELAAGTRSGDRVVDAEDVVARAGGFTLGPASMALRWRERVALAGHNGAGKSLLISCLTGAMRLAGGRVRLGAGVVPGVLRQGGADLAGAASGLDAFRAATGWSPADARTVLAKFDLGADHVLRAVATYSPGERCRLGLAVLMARGANWLVLDEPTNHLDLEAAEQLEQALSGFDGTLLVVSHDRMFLERIGITRRIELLDGLIVSDQLV